MPLTIHSGRPEFLMMINREINYFRIIAQGFVAIVLGLYGSVVSAHHWVNQVYDEHNLVSAEVIVQEFRFINPHPFVSVIMADSDDGSDIWTLEMDNRWELADLGITEDTFRQGDLIRIAANPSPFDDHALYVRVVEHPRLNFRYEHNVRRLFELEPE